jgi:SAM-dependent methyltransferase
MAEILSALAGVGRSLEKRVRRRLPASKRLRWGSLRRVTPVSRAFGLDRGWPLDRYYIERFLERHRGDIRGRVLEAGGLVNYTRKYGDDRVTRADVLYPKAGFADATVVADLETGRDLPRNAFDCIVLTQVFPFVYDLRAAIEHTREALKPGGVLLATVPGISQICRYDLERWGDYWRFTEASARRLFADAFGEANVEVEVRGNVLVACAFLQGLATQDLTEDELDYTDRDFHFSIAVRAVRAD